MAGRPGVVGLLERIDHRRAEGLGPRQITRVLRRGGPTSDGLLDGLDQDVGTVVGIGTVGPQRAIGGLVRLHEALRRRHLRHIHRPGRAVDRPATQRRDPFGKVARHDAIAATHRGASQAGHLLELLAEQRAAGGIGAAKIHHVGMSRRNRGQQRHKRGGGAWFATAGEHRAAQALKGGGEDIGNADAIGLGIVDHPYLAIAQPVQQGRAHFALRGVGGGNAEVGHVAAGAQRGHDVILAGARRRLRGILRQAGQRVGRTDQRDGRLVGNRHLGLGHPTVKRPDDAGHQGVTN